MSISFKLALSKEVKRLENALGYVGSLDILLDRAAIRLEEQQSHLRLLAEAVLEAHFQIATSHKCQCEACTVAREVMDDQRR